MRTREEIEERHRVFTQAFYFTSAHHGELSEEARAKQRALEENIGLLQWCLEDPDSESLTWDAVRRAFVTAFGLLFRKLFSRPGKSTPGTVQESVSTPREVIR